MKQLLITYVGHCDLSCNFSHTFLDEDWIQEGPQDPRRSSTKVDSNDEKSTLILNCLHVNWPLFIFFTYLTTEINCNVSLEGGSLCIIINVLRFLISYIPWIRSLASMVFVTEWQWGHESARKIFSSGGNTLFHAALPVDCLWILISFEQNCYFSWQFCCHQNESSMELGGYVFLLIFHDMSLFAKFWNGCWKVDTFKLIQYPIRVLIISSYCHYKCYCCFEIWHAPQQHCCWLASQALK